MAVMRFTCFCWCVLLVCSEVATGCTSGFMDIDLLRRRADKIPREESDRSENYLDGEFRLIPNVNFTCNGTITSLLIGATYRTGGRDRDRYPEVQVWRINPEGTLYTRQGSGEIRLAEGAFSPDGVLQYNLTTPISFQSGDVLGVYQPEESYSIVTLFYSSDASATTLRIGDYPTSSVSLMLPSTSGQQILISPVSDSPCTGNFLSPSELRQRVLDVNINGVTRRDNQQRLFPDINFTCNGSITKLIAGVEIRNNDLPPRAVMQIWRRDYFDPNTYTFVNSTLIRLTAPLNNSVIEHSLESPMKFQKGDILGMYQPQRDNTRLVFSYQERDGPENYRVNRASSTVTLGSPDNQYDYPLVTVEISTPSTSEAMSATSTTIGPSVTATATEGILPIVITTFAPPSSTPPPTPPGRGQASPGGNIAIIAGAVSALVVALTIGAIVLILAVVFACRRRSCKVPQSSQRKMTKQDTGTFDNPIYGDEKSMQSFCSSEQHHNEAVVEQHYSVPVINTTTTMPYSEISHYELPQHDYDALRTTSQSVNLIPSHYSTYQWGIVVPTLKQRNRLKSVPENPSDDVYATLASVTTEPLNQQAQQLKFFEETTVYWEPGSDCNSIYEQLSKMKYREIIRQQISLTSFLGSGQFGNVSKGVWHSPKLPVDVAIKTLKDEASEKERVMFLQEAAIMGQFHHPNIVKLHGVVTMGEPVMIVLELMKYGDLKRYLTALRPVPGELAPPSLPQQLLGYCRQIASGMEYLSKKSFVHRDLAARNILVEDGRTCKIADFGMSRDLQNENYYVSSGGQVPVKWTAPEALNYKKYSTASDVWSFGVLMYEIWSLGHKPFVGKSNQEALRMLHDGYRLPPPTGCTRAIYQLMIQCWHPETSGRPMFASLVSRLSQPENQLLKWTDRDKTHPQSTMLGAPLETAFDLHSDLQKTYT